MRHLLESYHLYANNSMGDKIFKMWGNKKRHILI